MLLEKVIEAWFNCIDILKLTFSPKAEAPLRCGNFAIAVGITGVEEGPYAHFILVQINGSQLSLVQIQVIVRVQLREHPSNGVLTGRNKSPVHNWAQTFTQYILTHRNNSLYCNTSSLCELSTLAS